MANANFVQPEKPFLLGPIDSTMIGTHFPLLLFFPIQPKEIDQAVLSFSSGFKRMLEGMPLLAGSVKIVSVDSGQIGNRAIVPPYRTAETLLTVKDMRKKTKYNYQSMRARGFPPFHCPLEEFTRLDLSCNIFPPVLHAQINLINGGVVLTASPNHCVTDGAGLESILEIWGACCKGQSIQPEEAARLLQRPQVPPYEDKVSVSDMPQCKVTAKSKDRYLPVSLRWSGPRIFLPIINSFLYVAGRTWLFLMRKAYPPRLVHFSAASLEDLKSQVAKSSPLRESAKPPEFISTLDALTALFFCCISQARILAHQQKDKEVSCWHRIFGWTRRTSSNTQLDTSIIRPRFFIAYNLRRCFPPDHPSNSICNNLTPLMLESHLNELHATLSAVKTQAQDVRLAIESVDWTFVVRAWSLARSAPDISKLDIDFGKHPEYAMLLTSWKNFKFLQIDWGDKCGGNAERVSVNSLFPGMALILPTIMHGKENGSLDVLLGLPHAEMNQLEKLEFFKRWARID